MRLTDPVRNEARLSKRPQEVIQTLGGKRRSRKDLDSPVLFIEMFSPLTHSDWLFLGLRFDKVNGCFGHRA
jgi:hypothetical protein